MVERRLTRRMSRVWNPASAPFYNYILLTGLDLERGCNSMVEYQPSKLAVGFDSHHRSISAHSSADRVTDFESGGRRFESYWAPNLHVAYGPLAQLAEHLTLNQGVRGPSP